MALGLIKKAHLDNKKPAFLWRGIEGLQGSLGKFSNLSTASECSKDEFKITDFPNLEMHKIVIPKPYPVLKSIHDTPQLKVQDDFKLTSRSAFRLCKLFETGEKESYPVGSIHTPQPKSVAMGCINSSCYIEETVDTLYRSNSDHPEKYQESRMLGKRSQLKLDFLESSARKALRTSAQRESSFNNEIYEEEETLEGIIIQRD